MDMWKYAISVLGLSGLAYAIVRLTMKYVYERQLKVFQVQMDQELAEYKTRLATMKSDHEICFSRLHERVLDKIENLYRLLTAFCMYLFDDTSDTKKRTQAFEEFWDFYYTNKIYFTTDICKCIEKMACNYQCHIDTEHTASFLKSMGKLAGQANFDDFGLAITVNKESSKGKDSKEFIEKHKEVTRDKLNKSEQELSQAKEALENYFREVLVHGISKDMFGIDAYKK